MARWDNEKVRFKQVEADDIPCKDCKYAKMNGEFAPTKGTCEKYELKPMDVLLNGDDCPEYKRK